MQEDLTGFDVQKAPFPWFGGKSKAAEVVWAALGDVCHYVEPFFGSGAVLLRRPHTANRPYYSETVNDADGMIVNLWRSIQMSPAATAEAASWPVTEADVHARHCALIRWRQDRQLEHLMGDPGWHDPVMAGWWVYGQCSWIGAGWCSGDGPWWPDADDRLTRHPRRKKEGVSRQLPHVSDDGMGVHRPVLREEGVSRKLPHVSDDGRGVHRPVLREEGVKRQLPHVSDDGMGVHRPVLREEGVSRKLPHVSDNGRGVHHAGLREEGVGHPYHPVTMPRLRQWFAYLSARLRHVRILNGDWLRAVKPGASKHIGVRAGKTPAGIFLDPPYAEGVRAADLYTVDCGSVALEVRQWCLEHGDDPQFRIVLAGFSGGGHEVLEDHGWTTAEWYKTGHLTGGYANQGEGTQQGRERLWLSPHCLREDEDDADQLALW